MKTDATKINFEEQKALTLFAADCAEHVLGYFEKHNPDDSRPRKAIEAARAWASGEIKMTDVRKFAFSAHAAARETTIPEAIVAARSSGHAAATAHVTSHAKYAAEYARRAAEDPAQERVWQMNCLPIQLKLFIEEIFD